MAPDRPGVRPGERRVRQPAQVPPPGRDHASCCTAGTTSPTIRDPRDHRPHARGDGARRHLRPARRRLPPLQRGRRVDRAALREDVVRQLGAAQGLSRRLRRCSAPRSTPTWRAGSCAGCARWRPTRRAATPPARTPTWASTTTATTSPGPATRPRRCSPADELDVAAAYYDIGTAGEMHHNPAQERAVRRRDACPVGRPARPDRGRTPRAWLSLRRAGSSRAARERAAGPVRGPHPLRQLERDDGVGDAARGRGAGRRVGARATPSLTLERLAARERASPTPCRTRPGGVTGLLDDQVQVAAAALDAYEATGDREWLALGRAAHGAGVAGLLGRGARRAVRYGPGRERRGRPAARARLKPVQDTPTPSPNGVAGIVCARLHELTGEARWRERAGAGGGLRRRRRRSSGSTLRPICWRSTGSSIPPTHWWWSAQPATPTAEAMHRAALAALRTPPGGPAAHTRRGGAPAAYPRRSQACSPPPLVHGLCLRGDELQSAGGHSRGVGSAAAGESLSP